MCRGVLQAGRRLKGLPLRAVRLLWGQGLTCGFKNTAKGPTPHFKHTLKRLLRALAAQKHTE